MKKLISGMLLGILSLQESVSAHCPLCTIGAGAAAVGAAYLGVSSFVIGIFIGAASFAMGLWISKLIKKKYIPFQATVISLVSFLSIIIPVMPMVKGYSSIYISMAGGYGTLLNRTYLINLFLLGSIIGALILLVSPYLSRKISSFRSGKIIPYQGIILTFILLIMAAFIGEVLI